MVSRKIEELLETCNRKYLVIVSGKSPLPNIYATLGRASSDIRKHYCTDDLGEVLEHELNSKLYIYALMREGDNHYRVLMYYEDVGKIRKLGEDHIELREPRSTSRKASIKIIFKRSIDLCQMMEILTQIYPELANNYVIEDNTIHIRLEGEHVDQVLAKIEYIAEKYRDLIEEIVIKRREKTVLRPEKREPVDP